MMKKAAIITVNYNGEQDVFDCLQSLYKLSLRDISLTIYVIDNHSKKENTYHLEETLKTFTDPKQIKTVLLKNAENLGFSGGNNVGIREAVSAGNEYSILLNNDTYVAKDLVEKLILAADAHGDAGIIAPKIYFAPGYEYHKDRYSEKEKGKVIWYAGGIMDWKNLIGSHRGVDEVDHGQFDDEELTHSATGCCMLIKREVIKKIGLLDEKYFMYFEDNDFSMRAKKAGFAILYTPKPVVWHKNASSSGGSGSQLQEYYLTRNRLLFGINYAPLRTKISLIKESFRLLQKGSLWQKRGVIDFYIRKLGRGSYAKA